MQFMIWCLKLLQSLWDWASADMTEKVIGVFVQSQLGTKPSSALRRGFQATEPSACETQDQDKALQVQVFTRQ